MADINKGWIYLYRCLLDCVIWEDREPFDRRSAWIDLLLLANHSDKKIVFNGEPMTITRGQYLTSVRKLADRWHWGKDRTLRYLRLLESLEMIKRDSDTSRTLLTIENYSVYQVVCDTNKDTHKDTHKDTNKDTDKPQTIKEINEIKEINNIKHQHGEFKHVKLTDDEYQKLADDFGSDKRDAAIKFLDEYIEDKGYKSKSHYMAMRRWVFDAIKDRKPKQNAFNNFQQNTYDVDDLERLIVN